MSPIDVEAEIWRALRTQVTRVGDSCFASNLAIPELKRHGLEMVMAVERVVRSPEFEEARQSEELVERNLLHLLLVYFEQADAFGWNSAEFLMTLEGKLLHEALVAVFQLWGPTRGINRRRVMPRALYEAWHASIARDSDWIGGPTFLSGYVAAGSLSLV